MHVKQKALVEFNKNEHLKWIKGLSKISTCIVKFFSAAL